MARTQFGLYDLDAGDLEKLNTLLRSANVTFVAHETGFTPMGGCKVLVQYLLKSPDNLPKPRREPGDDRDS